MTFELREMGERAEIACIGALDAASVAAFRPVAERALTGAAREVALRCERVTALDSSGVGAIVFLHRRLAEQGRTLRLAGLSGQPLALARLIGLDAALGFGADPDSCSDSGSAPHREGGVLARLARLLRPAAPQAVEA